jgi:aerobic carbon-monoxide dehydrogenase small subunit
LIKVGKNSIFCPISVVLCCFYSTYLDLNIVKNVIKSVIKSVIKKNMYLNINKKEYNVPDSYGEKRLTDYIRDELDLTGAKNACQMNACGACAVLLNNEVIKICHVLVKDAEGKEILTIEGMANPDGTLHPLQQAFVDAGAIQCGFCTPGMVLTAHAFLMKNPKPTRDQIRKALQGNLCRCTGYQQIIDAVEMASEYYRKN